ncbi:hypothetical protein [Pseudactinotalea sp. Z1748]|uniref:hypothetical protein n=1 Tax=Pseudactinotalea sp. Z1748 TaxID=3413027 RepID=UPI003C7B4A7F
MSDQRQPLAQFIAIAPTVPELDPAAERIADAAGLPPTDYHVVRLQPARPTGYISDSTISEGDSHSVTGWEAEYAVVVPGPIFTTQEDH